MEIKKVFQNEIFWTLKRWWDMGQQANKRLVEMLGPELGSSFAKSNIGAGFYSWTVPQNDNWTPMTQCTADDLVLVQAQWEQLKDEVRTRLAKTPDLAEHIIEIPNEDYIFYQKNADGSVRLLITGWGFRNFKRVVITPPVTEAKPQGCPVTVGFTIDGQPVPQRPFAIVATKKNNERITGDDGLCQLGNIDPGSTVTLIDGPTHKVFTLTANPGQDTFLFDVTEPQEEEKATDDVILIEEPKQRNRIWEILLALLLIATLTALGFVFHEVIGELTNTINSAH